MCPCLHKDTSLGLAGSKQSPTAQVSIPGKAGPAVPGCPCCQGPTQSTGNTFWESDVQTLSMEAFCPEMCIMVLNHGMTPARSLPGSQCMPLPEPDVGCFTTDGHLRVTVALLTSSSECTVLCQPMKAPCNLLVLLETLPRVWLPSPAEKPGCNSSGVRSLRPSAESSCGSGCSQGGKFTNCCACRHLLGDLSLCFSRASSLGAKPPSGSCLHLVGFPRVEK